MKDQFNLLCPYCTLCITDKDNKPCCSIYAKRINSFNNGNCRMFTSNAKLLRRQRWQLLKLMLISASIVGAILYLMQAG